MHYKYRRNKHFRIWPLSGPEEVVYFPIWHIGMLYYDDPLFSLFQNYMSLDLFRGLLLRLTFHFRVSNISHTKVNTLQELYCFYVVLIINSPKSSPPSPSFQPLWYFPLVLRRNTTFIRHRTGIVTVIRPTLQHDAKTFSIVTLLTQFPCDLENHNKDCQRTLRDW